MNHLLQKGGPEEHIWTSNTLYQEADGLQQQKKTTLGGNPINSQQELMLTVPTGSPKLDNRRLERAPLGLMSHDFCCDIQTVESECSANMKAQIHPDLCQQLGQASESS